MREISIGDCFIEIRNGANIKQGVIDGGYPITRIETLSNDQFNRERMGYAGISDLEKYAGFILEDEDLLMSHINSVQYLGRTVLYKKVDDEVIIHGMNLLKLKPNKKIVYPAYIKYLFYGRTFRNNISKITKKSVNQASFAIGDLKRIIIELPDIKEQTSIVDKLDRLEKVIELRTEQLVELDNLIKSRFVEMFDEIIEEETIGYYIESLTAGKSLAGEEECENKVLKTGAVSFDYFDATQVKNLPVDYNPLDNHKVKTGDIIISRMNTAELTGAAAYVWNIDDNIYLPDRLWRAELRNNCLPIFIWQLLIQPSTKEQIRREASGTSGSMKNISKSGLLNLKVKKVPIDRQIEFVDFVNQVDKLKIEVQRSLDETQQLFDSLMQQYFD